MKYFLAKFIYKILNDYELFDKAIDANGIARRLDETEKLIGQDYRTDIIQDRHIKRAIASLSGDELYERQANLMEIPLAERIKKIEEFLGIEFRIGNTRGYKKYKK